MDDIIQKINSTTLTNAEIVKLMQLLVDKNKETNKTTETKNEDKNSFKVLTSEKVSTVTVNNNKITKVKYINPKGYSEFKAIKVVYPFDIPLTGNKIYTWEIKVIEDLSLDKKDSDDYTGPSRIDEIGLYFNNNKDKEQAFILSMARLYDNTMEFAFYDFKRDYMKILRKEKEPDIKIHIFNIESCKEKKFYIHDQINPNEIFMFKYNSSTSELSIETKNQFKRPGREKCYENKFTIYLNNPIINPPQSIEDQIFNEGLEKYRAKFIETKDNVYYPYIKFGTKEKTTLEIKTNVEDTK